MGIESPIQERPDYILFQMRTTYAPMGHVVQKSDFCHSWKYEVISVAVASWLPDPLSKL